MNILFVVAHENPNSLCSFLSNYVQQIVSENHVVLTSDLYKQGFLPAAGKKDFTHQISSANYRYLEEQLSASKHQTFTKDIKEEMLKVEKAELIIFCFPIWWYSIPAILKGWFDRVLAQGWAYGDQWGTYEKGRFRDKKVAFVITLDGNPKNFTSEGKYKASIESVLYPVKHGTLYYCGFTTKDPFLVFEASLVNEGNIEQIKRDLRDYIDNLLNDCFPYSITFSTKISKSSFRLL